MIDNPSGAGGEMQLVVFRLGDDYFAVPITHVNQIIPLQKITPAFDWKAYHALSRSWMIWGAIATLAPLLALGLMVHKPALPGL